MVVVPVEHEYHAPLPIGKRQYFNNDFELCFFQSDELPQNRLKSMIPILPNTIGAELYCLANSDSCTPLVLTLMGGGSFPIKYYKRYISELEKVICESISNEKTWKLYDDQLGGDSGRNLLEPLSLVHQWKPLKQHRYLRVMVIHDNICFLTFPRHELPIYQGTRYRLVEGNNGLIDCCIDASGIVCFDGWLKTNQPQENDWKLASTRVTN
jgi:hypothetical protein